MIIRRVLAVTDRLTRADGSLWAGSATQLWTLARELTRRGCQCSLVEWAPTLGSRHVEGVEIVQLPGEDLDDYRSHVSSYLARETYDVLHVNNLDVSDGRRADVPVVTAAVHTNVWLQPGMQVELARRAACCDALVTVGPAYDGITTSRPIVRVPNGVADEFFDAARSEPMSLDRRCLRLLFAGRPVAAKGLPTAVGILDAFVNRGENAQLAVTGLFDGETTGHPSGSADGDCLVRLPWLAFPHEVADAYVSADAVVLPSDSEACGLVVLEALAAGTPVFASPGTILDVAASLFPVLQPLVVGSERPEDWADRIDHVVRDRRQREAIVAAGRSYCWRFGRASTMADRYEELWGRLGHRERHNVTSTREELGCG